MTGIVEKKRRKKGRNIANEKRRPKEVGAKTDATRNVCNTNVSEPKCGMKMNTKITANERQTNQEGCALRQSEVVINRFSSRETNNLPMPFPTNCFSPSLSRLRCARASSSTNRCECQLLTHITEG